MNVDELETFNLICEGKTVITQQNLSCYYTHHNKPHLRIGPFKTEELYYEPPILMFHDVISDDEIGELKDDAYPYVSCINFLAHSYVKQPLSYFYQ